MSFHLEDLFRDFDVEYDENFIELELLVDKLVRDYGIDSFEIINFDYVRIESCFYTFVIHAMWVKKMISQLDDIINYYYDDLLDSYEDSVDDIIIEITKNYIHIYEKKECYDDILVEEKIPNQFIE